MKPSGRGSDEVVAQTFEDTTQGDGVRPNDRGTVAGTTAPERARRMARAMKEIIVVFVIPALLLIVLGLAMWGLRREDRK